MIDKNKPVAIEGADWPVTIVDWDFDGNIAGIIETKSGKTFSVWKKDGSQILGTGFPLINVHETVETFTSIYAPDKEFTAGIIVSPRCSMAEAKKAADNSRYFGKHVAILKLKWLGDKLIGHELIEVE